MTDAELRSALERLAEVFPYLPCAQSPFYPSEKVRGFFLRSLSETLDNASLSPEIYLSKDTDAALVAADMPFDSRHFGIKMRKLTHLLYRSEKRDAETSLSGAIGEALRDSVAKGVKSLVAMASSKEPLLWQALEKSGFILAGLLVDYALLLKDAPLAGSSPLEIRPAEKADRDAIAQLAFEAFSDINVWNDHFHSDPFYPKERCDELYREWIFNSFTGDQADGVLAAYDRGAPVGFITLKKEKEKSAFFGKGYGNVPLNAVDRRYRKKGVYRSLVAAGLKWFRGIGLDVASVRTQASTAAVQRTWQSFGAKAEAFHLVFHKNFNP